MDWWFLREPQRLIDERRAVDELTARADWLDGVEWVLDGSVAILANIIAHSHVYAVRLTYPAHFPFAPPAVRPGEVGQRWSGHQYPDGTLCLEWGPDTWHPAVTAAQVLASVHRLLDTENPLGEGSGTVAPSRHQLMEGQSIRGRSSRVYVSRDLVDDFIPRLPVGAFGAVLGRFLFHRDSATFLVQEIRPVAGPPLWADPAIPSGVRGDPQRFTLTRGVFAVVALKATEIQTETLQRLYEAAVVEPREGELAEDDTADRPEVFLLAACDRKLRCFWVFDGQVSLENELAVVVSGPDRPRTPVELAELGEKKIAIVGLGSLGAAVALSLARMGARSFLLVDDDILLPENLCRHPLDWTGVGQHKVDALAEAMHRLVPGLRVDVSRLNLTGQENVASLNGLLKRLGKRDVIIDMTASPQVFNLLTAVSLVDKKPLVWAEVYAGGIGGLVARSRHSKDPDPQTMRAALAGFTASQPAPDFDTGTDYGAVGREGNVFVASEADVAVIAAHATGLAADCALAREPSLFPNSMYLIGLKRGWVFEAPFHTIPVATDHLLNAAPSKAPSKEAWGEMVTFLAEALRKKDGNQGA